MADTLTIITYNLHGFNQGLAGVDELISTHHPDILLLQEHWLTPANLSKFDRFDGFCSFGSSAMSDTVSSGMLVGRPFGGVMTLVHNRLRPITTVICCSDRYIIIMIDSFVIINVYLPCNGTPNRLNLCNTVLNEIYSLCEQYKHCKFIFGGDFNTNLDNSDAVSSAIHSFINSLALLRCNVACGVKCDKPTYVNDSLQCHNTIDYILCSVNTDVNNYDVLDLNLNFSDHLPVLTIVKCNLSLSTAPAVKNVNSSQENSYQLRWDHADLSRYCEFTRVNFEPLWHYVNNLSEPQCDQNGTQIIDYVHDKIVKIFTEAANLFVPERRKNFFKYWWNQELDLLKADSIKFNDIWKLAGKPKHGQIFIDRTRARMQYRNKLRDCQRSEELRYSNELHDALMAKNGVVFWKCWRSKFDKNIKINGVDGLFCDQHIADKFQQHFSGVSEANDPEIAENLRATFSQRLNSYCGLPMTSNNPVTTEIVSKILDRLPRGKAAGLDGITTEHLTNSCPIISCILAKLFNLMIRSRYVPQDFSLSYTIPLPKVKDTYCKTLTCSDFRGIAISSVLSKTFEHCILDVFGHFLTSSDNQFGFKKQLGCTTAIFTLRKIIDHHLRGGNTVNICSIDVSKAFDKTNHHGLLMKLMDRQTPTEIVGILHFWLSNSHTCVKWNGCFSNFYDLKFGVRQGSVLSPSLFALYLNDIHRPTIHSWFNAILYADDILLISTSISDLQESFLHWQSNLTALDLAINVKKSCCLRIGPRFRNACASIASSDGTVLPWVDKVKYLGIFITSAQSFRCCFDHAKRSFFRSTNAIFGKVGRIASEEVVLQLVQTKCLPVLLYATEVCFIPRHTLSSLDFVFTRFLMKLFKSNQITTINDCILFFNLKTPSQLIESRLRSFSSKFLKLSNSLCQFAFLV